MGLDKDRFQFFDGDGSDIVTDFIAGAGTDDQLILTTVAAVGSFAQVQALTSQAGANTVIDFGGGDMITLLGVTATDLHADDFLF